MERDIDGETVRDKDRERKLVHGKRIDRETTRTKDGEREGEKKKRK